MYEEKNGNIDGNRQDNYKKSDDGNGGVNSKRQYNNRQANRNEDSGYKNKKPFPKKVEVDERVIKRNKRIEDFFKLLGLSVAIFHNKFHPERTPNIVYNDLYILNLDVHNFELRFTDKPSETDEIGNVTKVGDTVYTVKLTEKPNFDKNKVLSCINDYEKKPVLKIALVDVVPALYLSGYNFLDREEKMGRYPVFSAYYPKIYFTKEKANEVYEELNQNGYKLKIV